MKITLIQLPLPSQIEKDELTFPLGPLALASFLKEKGHLPKIIDFDRLVKKNLLNYNSHFPKSAAYYLRKSKSKILGFYLMCNGQLPTAILISKIYKTLDPEALIVLGGPEAVFGDTDVLKTFKHLDVIVRGEGELTVSQLLSAVQNDSGLEAVQGITFRKNNTIVRNPDNPPIPNLDNLPLLNLSLLPHHKEYRKVFIEGGRGCPYHCTFCSASSVWKHKFRMKSPSRIIKEMLLFKKVHKADLSLGLPIIHDNLLTNRKLALAFLRKLKGLKLSWSCAGRLDVLDNKLIKSLGMAGCKALEIGVESGSKRMQILIGKNLNPGKLAELIPLLLKYNIHPTLNFILGLPGEAPQDLNQTLMTALRCRLYQNPPAVFMPPFIFIKGSSLYQLLEKRPILMRLKNARLRSPEEMALIKKYPRIFPLFCYIKNRAFNPFSVSLFYQYLVQFFPITTLLILKLMSFSPLGFYRKLVALSDQPRTSLKVFIKQTVRSDVVRAMAEHEQAFIDVAREKSVLDARKKRITSGSRPKLNPLIIIRPFNYNIQSIRKGLRDNKCFHVARDPSILAYIPGEIPGVISLGSAASRLLSLCDGKRNIKNIFHQLYGPRLPAKKRSFLLNTFRFMSENNLIIA